MARVPDGGAPLKPKPPGRPRLKPTRPKLPPGAWVPGPKALPARRAPVQPPSAPFLPTQLRGMPGAPAPAPPAPTLPTAMPQPTIAPEYKPPEAWLPSLPGPERPAPLPQPMRPTSMAEVGNEMVQEALEQYQPTTNSQIDALLRHPERLPFAAAKFVLWDIGVKALYEIAKAPERLVWWGREAFEWQSVPMGPGGAEVAGLMTLAPEQFGQIWTSRAEGTWTSPTWEETKQLLVEGEIGYTLSQHPERVEPFREDLRSGMPISEAVRKHEDRWLEFVMNVAVDPANLIPVTMMQKLWPGGALAGRGVSKAIGSVLNKIPAAEWLAKLSKSTIVRQKSGAVSDAATELLYRAPADEDAVEYFSRMLAGEPPNWSVLSDNTERVWRGAVGDFQDDGVRTLEDLVGRYLPEVSEILGEDVVQATLRERPELLAWMASEAMTKRTAREIGLVTASRRGTISRGLHAMGSVLKEQWLSANPAYVMANAIDNPMKALGFGHVVNPFDLSATGRVVAYMTDLGTYVPSQVGESLVGAEIGAGVGRIAEVPVPGVGRPAEMVNTLDTLFGKDFRAMVPWLEKVAPERPGALVRALGMAEPPTVAARILDKLNWSAAMQPGRNLTGAIEKSARHQVYLDEFVKYLEGPGRAAVVTAAPTEELAGIVGNASLIRSPGDITNLIGRFDLDDIPVTWPSSLLPEGPGQDMLGAIAKDLDNLQAAALRRPPEEAAGWFQRNADELFDAVINRAEDVRAAGEIEQELARLRARQIRTGAEDLLERARQVGDDALSVVRQQVGASPKRAGVYWSRYFDFKASTSQETQQEVLRMLQQHDPVVGESVEKLLTQWQDITARSGVPPLSTEDWGVFGETLATLRGGTDDSAGALWRVLLDNPHEEGYNVVKAALDDASAMWEEAAKKTEMVRRGYYTGKSGLTPEAYQEMMETLWRDYGFDPVTKRINEATTGLGGRAPVKSTWVRIGEQDWEPGGKGWDLQPAAPGSETGQTSGVFVPEKGWLLTDEEDLLHPELVAHATTGKSITAAAPEVPYVRLAGGDIAGGAYMLQPEGLPPGATTLDEVQATLTALEGLGDAGLPPDTLVLTAVGGDNPPPPGTINELADNLRRMLRGEAPEASTETLERWLATGEITREEFNNWMGMTGIGRPQAEVTAWWQQTPDEMQQVAVRDAQAGFTEDMGQEYARKSADDVEDLIGRAGEWRQNITDQLDDVLRLRKISAAERDTMTTQLNDLARTWANEIHTAQAKGALETGRVLYDYTVNRNWEEVLRNFFPFTKWQLRNPITWAQIAARRPAQAGMVARFVETAERERQERQLSSRFERTVPLPGQEWLMQQGVLPGQPGGHWGVDPSPLVSAVGQMREPWAPPEQEALTGIQAQAAQAMRVPQAAGVSWWPWLQAGAAAAGLQGMPSWGATGAAGRWFPQVAEAEARVTGAGGQEWLDEYWANQYLASYVAEGRATEQDVAAAQFDPTNPLYQQALQESQEMRTFQSRARFLQPFGVKYARPGEMEIRGQRAEMRGMPEERAAFLRSQRPGAAAYGRAVTGVEQPEVAAYQGQQAAVNTRYDEMIGKLPPWHPRVTELNRARQAELAGLGEAPERVPFEREGPPGKQDVMFQLEQDRPQPEAFTGPGGEVDWNAYNAAVQQFETVTVPQAGVPPGEYRSFRQRYMSPQELAWEMQQERLAEGWTEYGRLRGAKEGPTGEVPELGQWVVGEMQRRMAQGWSASDVSAWAREQTQLPYAEVQRLLKEGGFGPRPAGELADQVTATRPWLADQEFGAEEWGGFQPEAEMPGMFTPRTAAEEERNKVVGWFYDLMPTQRREARETLGVPEGAEFSDWLRDMPAEAIDELQRERTLEGLERQLPMPEEDERLQAELDMVRYHQGTGDWTDKMGLYYGDPTSGKSRFWDRLSGVVLSDEAYEDPVLAGVLSRDVRTEMQYTDEQFEGALAYLEGKLDNLVDTEAMALAEQYPKLFEVAQEEATTVRAWEGLDDLQAQYSALINPGERKVWKEENPEAWKQLTDSWDERSRLLVQNPHYLYFYDKDRYRRWYADTPPDSVNVKRELQDFLRAQDEMGKVEEEGGEWTERMNHWYGDDSKPSSQFWSFYWEHKGTFGRAMWKDPVVQAVMSVDVRDLLMFEAQGPLFEEALRRMKTYLGGGAPAPVPTPTPTPVQAPPGGGGGGGGAPPPPPPPPPPSPPPVGWLPGGQGSGDWM